MTILETAQQLWHHFEKTDFLCLPDDRNKVILISENEEKDLLLIRLAIKQFEESKILSYGGKSNDEKHEYWFLNKSLSAFEQNITLSAITTDALAKTINKVCEKMKTDKDLCDAKNITEKDIQNLIVVCNSLMESTIEEKE